MIDVNKAGSAADCLCVRPSPWRAVTFVHTRQWIFNWSTRSRQQVFWGLRKSLLAWMGHDCKGTRYVLMQVPNRLIFSPGGNSRAPEPGKGWSRSVLHLTAAVKLRQFSPVPGEGNYYLNIWCFLVLYSLMYEVWKDLWESLVVINCWGGLRVLCEDFHTKLHTENLCLLRRYCSSFFSCFSWLLFNCRTQ